jgi:hypothetical protein
MKKFILFISLVLISAGCKKQKECQWSHFTFEHPVSVYPVKESYAIGDTIWFEMNFSDVFNAIVKNSYNGNYRTEVVQLKDFDFHRTFISFVELVDSTVNSGSQNVSGWPSFTPIYELGFTQTDNGYGVEFDYNYSNSSYSYKLGIICNKTGRFVYNSWFLHYYPAAHGQLNEVDIRPDCHPEHIEDITFPVNRQANGKHLTNYHLFESYMNPELENNLDQIKNNCFTFFVN